MGQWLAQDLGNLWYNQYFSSILPAPLWPPKEFILKRFPCQVENHHLRASVSMILRRNGGNVYFHCDPMSRGVKNFQRKCQWFGPLTYLANCAPFPQADTCPSNCHHHEKIDGLCLSPYTPTPVPITLLF